MRLRLSPIRGKYRVLQDAEVIVSDYLWNGRTNVPRSVLNPQYFRITAGTVFSIKGIKETVNRAVIDISFPRALNDKRNPWAGISIRGYSSIPDFDVEVEKLP